MKAIGWVLIVSTVRAVMEVVEGDDMAGCGMTISTSSRWPSDVARNEANIQRQKGSAIDVAVSSSQGHAPKLNRKETARADLGEEIHNTWYADP